DERPPPRFAPHASTLSGRELYDDQRDDARGQTAQEQAPPGPGIENNPALPGLLARQDRGAALAAAGFAVRVLPRAVSIFRHDGLVGRLLSHDGAGCGWRPERAWSGASP